MMEIVAYLDCGCAIYENGERAVCPTCEAASRLQLPTALTLKEIVSAAIDEFARANGVSDQDIEMFLAKLGVEAVKRRLLAGQSVGEAYEEGGK